MYFKIKTMRENSNNNVWLEVTDIIQCEFLTSRLQGFFESNMMRMQFRSISVFYIYLLYSALRILVESWFLQFMMPHIW